MNEQGSFIAENRHSWAWQGCGSSIKKTVGRDILEGTSQPCLSNSVEVLKSLDDQKRYEMMMRVPFQEKESRYSFEPSTGSSGLNGRLHVEDNDIFRISNQDIDLTMDADTLMVELGELKTLIANDCTPGQ